MSRRYDRDPYVILRVSPSATHSQIKEAYHRLARQYHPDVNKDPRASERMQDINWANDILGDPVERSRYDLWRTSGVRVTFYPGTKSPHSHAPPGSSPPPHAPPPYNPPPSKSAPSRGRVAQNTQAQGRSPLLIIWLVLMIFMSVVRTVIRQVPQTNYNYSFNVATRKAQEQMLISNLETLRASQGYPDEGGMYTPSPSFLVLSTPSPINMIQKEQEVSQRDWRSKIVPGSWEWDHINQYFPELTTSSGLSDEVTLVTYDQLRGYRIQTRSLGEYWILVDRINHSLWPVHYSPTASSPP